MVNLPDDILVFSDPGFDTAIIGVSHDDRAVYDYDKMVEWYVENYQASYEDAVDWIDYNTLRSLPYMGDQAPIVVFGLCD